MKMCVSAALIFLVLFTPVTSEFLGFNVSSKKASPDGYTSVVLEGLHLIPDVVTGLHLDMARTKCPVKFQVWRRHSYLLYNLVYETSLDPGNSGHVFIPLPRPEQFTVSSGDNIGFTSLHPFSSCVAYTLLQQPEKRAHSLRRFFSSRQEPTVGQNYHFEHYRDVFLFGIGVETLFGSSFTRQRVPSGEEKIFGYNITSTSFSQNDGESIILLESVTLTEGEATGFYVQVAGDCSLQLQVWRPTTASSYTLIWEMGFYSDSSGYYHVPTTARVSVQASDKIGFASLDSPRVCIAHQFTKVAGKRTQTLIYPFHNDKAAPALGSTKSFLSYQTSLLFGVQVVIEEVILLLPGPPGVKGPPGVTGVTGQPSDEAGTAGVRGTKGRLGDQGPKGEDGVSGVRGSAGIEGHGGSLGFSGQTGIIGKVSGPRGETGSVGDTGLPGSQGESGPRGPVGSTGKQGATGEPLDGERGMPGPVGTQGVTGRPGSTGNAGGEGHPGVTGPVGSKGMVGHLGPMWEPKDFCKEQNVSCEYECVNTLDSAVCKCPPGYKLSDTSNCVDINECSVENGLCQYDCVNTEGSFRCECPPGLYLSLDMTRCRDVDECATTPNLCEDNQICINQWGFYYCAGPWDDPKAEQLSFSERVFGVQLVTRQVLIGLILWLVIITLLTVVALILFISELNEHQHQLVKEQTEVRTHRQDFFYPAFFPRISLDNRVSAETGDVFEADAPSRRMSTNEMNAVSEEIYPQINRPATADTERKKSNL